jgi:geranylgeranylglycerol-phosphate geranylgeranyltransferase
MKRLREAIILTRPINCLITFLSLWVGAIVAGKTYLSWRIMIAAISASAIAAFGNVVNDIFDIKIDLINKPFRPLPKGLISKKEAIIIACILAIAGLALSIFVSEGAFALAFCAVILLLIYTPIFKGSYFLGNILIAFVSSLVFIYGGMAVDHLYGAVILSIYAFFLHLGREIVKDIQDRHADMAQGQRTGAALDHARTAREVASLIFGTLIVITAMPFIAGIYKYGYMITVLLGTDIILIFSIYHLLKNDRDSAMRHIAVWLKVAMPFGLLAVFLGSRGW